MYGCIHIRLRIHFHCDLNMTAEFLQLMCDIDIISVFARVFCIVELCSKYDTGPTFLTVSRHSRSVWSKRSATLQTKITWAEKHNLTEQISCTRCYWRRMIFFCKMFLFYCYPKWSFSSFLFYSLFDFLSLMCMDPTNLTSPLL